MNRELFISSFLLLSMIILSLLLLGCIIYAIRGPKFSDRLVASNMICTIAVIFISILSIYLKETGLVDIALVYTLLSSLSGIIVCYVIAENHHKKNDNK